MLILFKKKKSTLATIIVLSLIGTLGFKDTGIFVKEFVAIGRDGSEMSFKAEESANILREGSKDFIVEKNLREYPIPKDAVLRTEKKSNQYIVKAENTQLMDKPNDKIIKILNVGDKVLLEDNQGEYGIFNTEDGIKGYILLENLDEGKEEVFTIGTVIMDKTLKGEKNTYYVLAKGETVLIKDFKNEKFIIVNENGDEFQAAKDYISLKNSRPSVSRLVLSRRTSTISSIVQNAHKVLGKPYVRGDTGRKGYDCSGLTYSLYNNELGINIDRSSAGQSKNGNYVNKSELIPGDLVFFNTTGKGISHVGLYIGDGNMIHASSRQKKVIITSIDANYYRKRYVTARRIIK